MSFNGSGTFSINTAGQPVVSGTTITSTAFNALTSDLATGLSTCMLKDGTQTATAGIGFYAGTVSLPGIYFGTDTATGLYRIGLNNTGYAINGTKLLDLSAAAFAVTGTISATSTISATTSLLTPSTTFNLVNATATTINFAGAATTLNIGNAGGTNTVLGATTFSQALNASGKITGTATGVGIQLTRTAATAGYIEITDGTRRTTLGTAASDEQFVGSASAHDFNVSAGGSNLYGKVAGDIAWRATGTGINIYSGGVAGAGSITGGALSATTGAFSGAISGTGADNNIILSQNGGTQWRINNSNAGAAASALLSLQNGTASASLNLLGTGYTTSGSFIANRLVVYNNNAAGIAIVADNASGTINFATGGLTAVASIGASGGLQMGSPTGGDKGSGTINVAADIYKNNTAYTNPDYVLEKWATGKIVKFADKDGAKEYTGLMPLRDVEAFARTNLHLPRFGQKAGHGLFSGSDAILASVEESYLHLFNHEARIAKLEEMLK